LLSCDAGTDEPNARLIGATKARANLVFDWRLDAETQAAAG
jgi:hypothetical protein